MSVGNLSKARTAYLVSLQQKKFRQKYRNFIAEGGKIVAEILSQQKFRPEGLYALPAFLDKNAECCRAHPDMEVVAVSEREMEKISALHTPSEALVVLREADFQPVETLRTDRHYLVLDGIRDPGNLGTLIRLADWFGIDQVLCSLDCAEIHAPKTVQATMGSFLRVEAVETELAVLFDENPQMPVYGALLEGTPLPECRFAPGGFLLIGSESHGIRPELLPYVTDRVTIPRYGGAESLNAAVAAGILLMGLKAGTWPDCPRA
jgi:TrmH family RNA methyltransferase